MLKLWKELYVKKINVKIPLFRTATTPAVSSHSSAELSAYGIALVKDLKLSNNHEVFKRKLKQMLLDI